MEKDSSGNPPETPKANVWDDPEEPEHNAPETTKPATSAEAPAQPEELAETSAEDVSPAPKPEPIEDEQPAVEEKPAEAETKTEEKPAEEEPAEAPVEETSPAPKPEPIEDEQPAVEEKPAEAEAEEKPAEEPIAPEPETINPEKANPSDDPFDKPAYDPIVAARPAPTSEPTPEIKAALANLDDTSPVISLEPDQGKNKKSKGPLAAILIVLLLALGGAGYWYFFLNKSTEPIAESHQEDEPEESAIKLSELALQGNDLSDFDLAFMRLEDKEENLVYSPLSIKYALAMLQDGANGESKEQITSVIGNYRPKAYINSEHRSLANAIFIRDSFSEKVLPSYSNALSSKYNASVVFDPFASAANLNKWVGDQTLGIINNFAEDNDVKDLDFMLVNALAIDMNWNNQLQCLISSSDDWSKLPCIFYDVKYSHEKYSDSISEIFPDESAFEKIVFNNRENTKSAKIGASVNRYNIIEELGEDKIRETVEEAYQKVLEEDDNLGSWPSSADEYYRRAYSNESYDGLNQYVKELSENYGKIVTSTDFYFLDTDNEKVFAKDLQEYDGSTLQYVGIMPKTGSLTNYISSTNAEKIASLIGNLKDPSDVNNFKEGVITKIKANIPFFKFSYVMKELGANLAKLGIVDVFESNKADLTGIVAEKGEYIDTAIHKADIEFSNDGIKAAAATGIGGRGATRVWDYKFDVPVEEIDLTFDQPFLFIIRDKSSGEVWFTGTVYKGVESN